MTFANFIFVIFLLVSLLIFVVLVLLIRQIKKDGNLSDKKVNKLSAILFIPAIIIFVFIFKQISDWRTDIRNEQEQLELNSFVETNHKPLLISQNAIQAERYKIQRILQKMESMVLEHPNHEQLIFKAIERWNRGLQELWNAYTDTSREIRYYWLLSKTKEGQDVKATFSKRAIALKTNNKKADKKYQKIIFSIRGDLVKSLDRARKLLDANRRPSKNKKQRAINQLIRQNMHPFNDGTVSNLVNFMGQIDVRLKTEVEKLQELIRTSGQQSIIIRNFLQDNPDLETPLTITINNWLVLEHNSRKRLNQILYAIEAEFIALHLDLPLKSAAIRAMHKSLLKNVPLIVGKALKQKKNIDQSYNISPK